MSSVTQVICVKNRKMFEEAVWNGVQVRVNLGLVFRVYCNTSRVDPDDGEGGSVHMQGRTSHTPIMGGGEACRGAHAM